MANGKKRVGLAISWQRIVILLLLAVGIYGLAPQVIGFGDSFKLIGHARLSWLLVAFTVISLSYLAAAVVYVCLAKRLLKIGATSLVQLASNFANRLLPAGIGAIAVNNRYLRQAKHTEGQASAIVLLNNLFGFLGNMILLFICITCLNVQPQQHSFSLSLTTFVVIGAVGIAALIIVLTIFGKKLRKFSRDFRAAISSYRKQPLRLLGALAASILLTACYAVCLWACTKAVGLNVGIAAVFISMSLGVAGATVTPTPGGLGGAEAALVASLVLYGTGRPAALAAVLLYRSFTFWLPLVVGGFALVIVRQRKYI